MKKHDSSKVFSIRADGEIIQSLDRILIEKGINRNNFLNDIITSYVIQNKEKISFEDIPLAENIEKLGFEKIFFSKQDAQFIHNAVNFMNGGVNDSSEFTAQNIQRLYLTGVKYSFKRIGLNIYTTFDFAESRNDNNNPILNLYTLIFFHYEKTDTFGECNDFDYLTI